MIRLDVLRFALSILLVCTTMFAIYATGAALFTGAWKLFFIAVLLLLANLGATLIVSILSA